MYIAIILYYSILYYSILFYSSILYYSILLYITLYHLSYDIVLYLYRYLYVYILFICISHYIPSMAAKNCGTLRNSMMPLFLKNVFVVSFEQGTLELGIRTGTLL